MGHGERPCRSGSRCIAPQGADRNITVVRTARDRVRRRGGDAPGLGGHADHALRRMKRWREQAHDSCLERHIDKTRILGKPHDRTTKQSSVRYSWIEQASTTTGVPDRCSGEKRAQRTSRRASSTLPPVVLNEMVGALKSLSGAPRPISPLPWSTHSSRLSAISPLAPAVPWKRTQVP